MSDSKKLIGVIGASGAGKSYFIKSRVAENVVHSNDIRHVTRETKVYASTADPSISFMDTLGTNVDLIPIEKWDGYRVVLVVILTSGRPHDEMEEVLKKVGTVPCYFYFSYKYENPPLMDPPVRSIHDFCMDDLNFPSQPHTSRLSGRAPANAAPATIRNGKAKAKKQANMKKGLSELLFNQPEDKLGENERRVLYMYEADVHLIACKQTKADLKILNCQTMVTKYRLRGETILKYFLQCMDLPQIGVDGLIGNERLSAFLRIWNLEEHFSNLYADADTPNAETRADYVEALFGYIYANHKRMIVDLLVKIMTPQV